MKIIILLSAGILILGIIIIAWKYYDSSESQINTNKKEVTIHLKAITENGDKRLKLSDSNGNTAIDNLITEVSFEGANVTWKMKAFSNIEKIIEIKPEAKEIKIFVNAVERVNDKEFKLTIPKDIIPGTMEKYIIKCKHTDGDTLTIDPYIRIED